MSTLLLGITVGWEFAIQDAERQFEKAKGARASILQGVIATFKEKLRRGEPWPGSDGYTVTQASHSHTGDGSPSPV